MNPNHLTLILAPLQGFTDLTYRNVYAEHFSGIDEAVAPFISTMGQARIRPSLLKDVALEKNLGFPVVPQIMGNSAKDFILLASHLWDMGHKRINWNLGCPHDKVAKKIRGSGLLPYPDKIGDLLAQILPNIDAALSVKIRLGRHSKDEIFDLLAMFDQHPIEGIILHPRTGIQMYEGKADLDAFGKALETSCHTFTYNGDIIDKHSFDRVVNRFPHITRVMIGRGILANPFLAEDIKGIQKNSNPRPVRLKAFHDDLMAQYALIFSGPGHLTDRMKGFWTYLGPSFKDSRKPLKQILKSTSLAAYTQGVEDFFFRELEFPSGPGKSGNPLDTNLDI